MHPAGGRHTNSRFVLNQYRRRRHDVVTSGVRKDAGDFFHFARKNIKIIYLNGIHINF